METVKLSNGFEMPVIGLGTWQITDRVQMAEVVANAYRLGYRLIDTASAYCNEIAVSKAIALANIDREELFLCDKVWNTDRGAKAVQEACKRSLRKLKTDYLDLYLIHWPASIKLYPDWKEINSDTWAGMEQLYRDGLVRAIGVCNFKRHHIIALEKYAKILPMINQVELHPGYNQQDLIEYCFGKDIKIVASSPLGNGQILNGRELNVIAESKHKSAAQICLRWGLQKGVIVIPKTTKTERLAENICVFDFDLSNEEMKTIDNIAYCGGIGIDPDEVTDFG